MENRTGACMGCANIMEHNGRGFCLAMGKFSDYPDECPDRKPGTSASIRNSEETENRRLIGEIERIKKEILDTKLYTVEYCGGEFLCMLSVPGPETPEGNPAVQDVPYYKKRFRAAEAEGTGFLNRVFFTKLFATREEAEEHAQKLNSEMEQIEERIMSQKNAGNGQQA